MRYIWVGNVRGNGFNDKEDALRQWRRICAALQENGITYICYIEHTI